MQLILSGKKIHSLLDIYNKIDTEFSEYFPYFGKNLDALFDILQEGIITEVVIEDFDLLKKNLSENKEEDRDEMGELFSIFLDSDQITLTYKS